MPRSRSRSRERKRRDRSRDKRRSRSRSKCSKSRDRHSIRDKDRDRDSRNKHHKRDRRDDRSYEKERRRRDSRDKRRRSSSSDERHHKSSRTNSPSKTSIKPIIITASRISGRSKANRAAAAAASSESVVDHRESFEISQEEFSQEGFEQFSRDHGIDFSNIDTDEDRQALHEKMEQVLKEHFEAQGKVYPPVKPEKPAINAATGFANDGSFLEQFKKMQDEYKQQMEDEKKRRAAEERLKSLPLRRRGGKILKTGIVAKTTATPSANSSADAWSLYFKEVQKYKRASCDSDAPPTRPLVK